MASTFSLSIHKTRPREGEKRKALRTALHSADETVTQLTWFSCLLNFFLLLVLPPQLDNTVGDTPWSQTGHAPRLLRCGFWQANDSPLLLTSTVICDMLRCVLRESTAPQVAAKAGIFKNDLKLSAHFWGLIHGINTQWHLLHITHAFESHFPCSGTF